MKYIVRRAGNANVGCFAGWQQEFVFPDLIINHHAIMLLCLYHVIQKS